MKRNWHSALATALALVSIHTTTFAARGTDDARAISLDQRLAQLNETLETKRNELNVPGLAIVIVKDDEVILSRGFGVTDVENDVPVTEDTLFMIGSVTKSFTSALGAMMIDEGALDWDDPVRKHLPWFALADEEVTEKVTLRDTLSHRTGLNRTDMLWASGNADRETILKTVGGAELYSPFRETFHYNNVMYLAAGEAIAHAAGSDWDSLIRERLLEPLGMADSSTTLAEARQHPELARGYEWDEETESFEHRPMRAVDNCAPAGSINSTARDMAHYLRLQLNRGTIDGKRLIAEERFDEMWEGQIDMQPGMEYGLGWMVREWDGRRLIEHGGNIDGFAAQMAMLPDERDHGIGFVLLANVTHTPLQQTSIHTVFSALLHDPDKDCALDLAELERYVGKYHFTMMNDDVTVFIKDGTLAVDVPGQMAYELLPPDDEGKWAFALTDTIKVSFVYDDEDAESVTALVLHQAGMEFEMLREGVRRPIDVVVDEVRDVLGRYRSDELETSVELTVIDGRLAMRASGQPPLEFRRDAEVEDRWVAYATDMFSLVFDRDASGMVTALHLHEGQVVYEMPRVADADDADSLPTIEEIIARYREAVGADDLDALGTVRFVGSAQLVHQGIEAKVSMLADNTLQRHVQVLDMGVFGRLATSCVGDEGWMIVASPDVRQARGEQLKQLRLQHPLLMFSDWRDHFEEVSLVGRDDVDGEAVYVIDASLSGSARLQLFLHADNGLLVKQNVTATVPGVGQIPTEVTYEDYREVNGVKFPFVVVSSDPFMGRIETRFATIETGLDMDDAAFKIDG